METMTSAPPATAVKISDPSGLEPCDRCAQSALWRVTFAPGELLFCGHHARGYGFAGEDSHHAYQQPAAKPRAKAAYKGKHEKGK